MIHERLAAWLWVRHEQTAVIWVSILGAQLMLLSNQDAKQPDQAIDELEVGRKSVLLISDPIKHMLPK